MQLKNKEEKHMYKARATLSTCSYICKEVLISTDYKFEEALISTN